jgi:hypothetical protein
MVVNSVLWLLYRVDVGDVTDVVEVYAASIFRVKVCEEGQFLCVYFRKTAVGGRGVGRAEIGASSSQTSLTSNGAATQEWTYHKKLLYECDGKHQIHNGKRFGVNLHYNQFHLYTCKM